MPSPSSPEALLPGPTNVRISLKCSNGRYLLLSYGTEPARHRLAEQGTQELKAFAMAQVRQALARVAEPDGKRGNFSWAVREDRMEIKY